MASHQRIESFLSSTTWVCPADVTEITVEAWGAGGGGSADQGGGGGGAYSKSTISVTPSTSYDITVGQPVSNEDGGDGIFGANLVVAKGGKSGANGGNGGAASAGTGDTKYSGGNAATGTGDRGGGGGAGDSEVGVSTTTNIGALGGESQGGRASGASGGFISGTRRFVGGGGASTETSGSISAGGLVKLTYNVDVIKGAPQVLSRNWFRENGATKSSHPVVLPSGVTSGDFLLLVCSSSRIPNDETDFSINKGWSRVLLTGLGGTFPLIIPVYTKIADGDDTPTITTNGNTRINYQISRIRRFQAATYEDAVTGGSTTSAISLPSFSFSSSLPTLFTTAYLRRNTYPNTETVPPSGFKDFLLITEGLSGGDIFTATKHEVTDSSPSGSWGSVSGGSLNTIVYLAGIQGFEPLSVAGTTTTNIGFTTANAASEVLETGGEVVTRRGFYLSTSPISDPGDVDPDTLSGIVFSESGTFGAGAYSLSLTSLDEETTYYVRAFAENVDGFFYGEESTFTTQEPAVPTVTTGIVENVTNSTADVSGEVTDDNGATITERGVVYSTSPTPTTSDNKQVVAGTLGVFTTNLSGLDGRTTYYARAYAINNKGTSYGSEVVFATGEPPIVVTLTVTNRESQTATLNAEIDDGNRTLIQQGFVYDTTPLPTPEVDPAVSDYTNVVFTVPANITGLNPNQTYYYRAFAENEFGLVYGDEQSFTTVSFPNVTGIENIIANPTLLTNTHANSTPITTKATNNTLLTNKQANNSGIINKTANPTNLNNV